MPSQRKSPACDAPVREIEFNYFSVPASCKLTAIFSLWGQKKKKKRAGHVCHAKTTLFKREIPAKRIIGTFSAKSGMIWCLDRGLMSWGQTKIRAEQMKANDSLESAKKLAG